MEGIFIRRKEREEIEHTLKSAYTLKSHCGSPSVSYTLKLTVCGACTTVTQEAQVLALVLAQDCYEPLLLTMK